MIFIFSIALIFFGICPIIYIKYNPDLIYKSPLKTHMILFFIKLIINSMFIYLFIFNLSISNTKLFIILGCFIFIVFHFIEGFISQNILVSNGK